LKKNIPDSVLESIVVDKLFFGAKTEDICKKNNLSRAFVNATVAAYKAVEAGDWEKVSFMLDGAQCNIKTVEWAAGRIGVTVPESFYQPKEEPKHEAPAEPVGKTEQLEGQTKLPDFDSVSIRFSTGANNTLHALIDALNRNADEAAQLRSAVFALLNSAAVVD
jgi:hypothetical protein